MSPGKELIADADALIAGMEKCSDAWWGGIGDADDTDFRKLREIAYRIRARAQSFPTAAADIEEIERHARWIERLGAAQDPVGPAYARTAALLRQLAAVGNFPVPEGRESDTREARSAGAERSPDDDIALIEAMHVLGAREGETILDLAHRVVSDKNWLRAQRDTAEERLAAIRPTVRESK